MGKKRGGNAGTISHDRKLIDELWRKIKIPDFLRVLSVAAPLSDWKHAGPARIVGKCPFHNETNPSFNIHLDQRRAFCYGCGKFFWDPVHLCADIKKTDYMSTLAELKDQLSLPITGVRLKEINTKCKHRTMKEVLHVVTRDELVDAYKMRNSLSKDMSYASKPLRYLAARNIDLSCCHTLPIGILPPRARLQKLVEQYTQKMGLDKKTWTRIEDYMKQVLDGTEWLGAVLFFTGVTPKDVCKVKVRATPHVSAGGEILEAKKVTCYIIDDQEDHNGIFGLYGASAYLPHLASKDPGEFHLMEGEFDALSIMSRQFKTNNVGFYAFSGGGSSVGTLDLLKAVGFVRGFVIPDRDAGGEEYVKGVLSKTKQMPLRIFRWPLSLETQAGDDIESAQKIDPDIAVNAFGLEAVTREFTRLSNYQYPYEWALDRARDDMSKIDSADVQLLTKKAANWVEVVSNNTERDAYLDALANEFGIKAGSVRTEMVLGEDSAEAFVERLRSYLDGRLHVIHAETNVASHSLAVYDAKTKKLYDLFLNDPKQNRNTIEMLGRADIYSFIRDEVGLPGFIQPISESNTPETALIQYSNLLAQHLAMAVSKLSASLPLESELYRLGLGLHCIHKHERPAELEVLYLVNGMDLYRGLYEEDERLVWKKMSGPSDGQYIVDIREKKQLKTVMTNITSAEDLNQAAPMTIEELYDAIYEVIDLGWDFKNHKVTCEMLTALVMQLCITNCFPHQPQIMFTSEFSGGKSSFMGGLIGRTHVPSINLFPLAFYSDNYTAAGVRQKIENSTLVACLDEFEDKGGNDRISNIIRDILRMFRGSANEGGSSIYGTTSGVARENRIDCPLVVAMIREIEDHADVSRFIRVETDRTEKHLSPEALITSQLGSDRTHKIREAMPLVLFPLARKAMETYKDIKTEYEGGKRTTQFGEMSRTRSMYYGVMTMMKLAGRDYHSFIQRYFRATRSDLQRISSRTHGNDLFQTLLNTPGIKLYNVDGTPREYTLNAILSSDQPERVNEAHCGIYYDPESKWLLVHWTTVKGYFSKTRDFQDSSAAKLKLQCARIAHNMADQKVQRSGIIRKMRSVMGVFNDPAEISVFSTKGLREENSAKQKAGIRGKEVVDLPKDVQEKVNVIKFPQPEKKAATVAGPPTATSAKKKTGSGGNGGSSEGGAIPASIDDEFDI